MTSRDEMLSFARRALGLSESVPIEFSPLGRRGSDRAFFRLKWNLKDSVILIHYDPKCVENTCYADIAAFLQSIQVSVPYLIRHDPVGCLIAMEDLGDTDLWSLRRTPWETRRLLYQKTLTVVHRIHSFPQKAFPSGRVRLMEGYGPDLYRWERDYFRNQFVKDVCKITMEPSFEEQLELELSALAERLARASRCLVHRDLQSQNVMIREGEPYLIDFQGMRFGNPFYDLASLLCDPYVDFSCGERDELLSFYYGLSNWNLDRVSFQSSFWEASAQRLMQALGAYGFLGLKKGLTAFLKHIPSGLRNLHLGTGHVPSLPRLKELCASCQRVILAAFMPEAND